ncbi:MAG: FAD-dependent monooxygenase [Planctomycetes bacterium]|nr:FAD-dependent monooxygenase [Planctomycetota bacterium]
MTEAFQDCDVLVIGGGPAGAMLAGLLARRGRTVLLCDDGHRRHPLPAETILPAALAAFARIGVADELRALTSEGALRHGAIWEDAMLQWRAAEPAGRVVLRGRFDAGLRAFARRCGARVLPRAKVPGPLADAVLAAGEGEVTVHDGEGRVARVRARGIAIAAGARGVQRLLPIATLATRPANALLGVVGDAPAAARDAELVEALPEGWLWSIPLQDGRLGVAVFTEPALLIRDGTRTVLRRLLAAASGPARELGIADLERAARVQPALRATAARVFLLGDAASTIDPLASQGLEKAIAAAEDCAAALDTLLDEPALRDPLLAHRARWEAELWHAHAKSTVEQHARARFASEPFWRERSQAPATTAPLTLRPDQHLIARRDLLPAPAVRRRGERFVREDGVTAPTGEAIARVAGVPILPLLAAFAQPHALEHGIDRAGLDPRLYVLPRAQVREATRELVRRGLLTAIEATRGSR